MILSGSALSVLVGGVVVEDDMDDLARRNLALDAVEKADELLMAVAGHVLSDHRAIEHVQRGEERGGPVALVIMGHRRAPSLFQRPAGLGAVKRLNLRLFVDREHHRMRRRGHIEADDVRELLDEGRIVRQLEAAPAMGAEAVRLPDRLHRRGGDAGDLRHRAQRPVGRLMWRRRLRQPDDLGHALRRDPRLAGRTGLVMQQAVGAVGHEPLLPAPDAGLRLAGPGHDGGCPEAVAAQQDDPCPPDMFLRALGVRDDRLQSLTVAG